MRSFRDIKRRARRDLHREMQVPALYVVKDEEPLPISVRVHTKFLALGDQKGTNFQAAEREEAAPKIILLRHEVPKPVRNAIVSVERGEAYRIDHTEPHDDLTVTAYVVRCTDEQAKDLPVPGDG